MRAALCHQCNVIRSRDVIGYMTIRLIIDDFLYAFNRNRIRIWLSFHDVITNVILDDQLGLSSWYAVDALINEWIFDLTSHFNMAVMTSKAVGYTIRHYISVIKMPKALSECIRYYSSRTHCCLVLRLNFLITRLLTADLTVESRSYVSDVV